MTQIAKRANISAVYLAGVRHRGDGTLDAGLAQQVEHGIGRAIGVVFDVFGLRSRELVLGMKARDLQFSFQTQFDDGRLADVEKIVVLMKSVKTQGWINRVVSQRSGSAACRSSNSERRSSNSAEADRCSLTRNRTRSAR